MTHDISAAVQSALEWQDFLTHCDRNDIHPAEEDYMTWRAEFAAWRETRESHV